MLKIVEYVGPVNNQNIEYGTPFLVIGFCAGEWELSKTTYFDIKEAPEKVGALMNALAVTLSVGPEHYEKFFRSVKEIEWIEPQHPEGVI